MRRRRDAALLLWLGLWAALAPVAAAPVAALAQTPPPFDKIAAVYHRDFGPRRVWALETEHPEFQLADHAGAMAFNTIMRDFVQGEIDAFIAAVGALPRIQHGESFDFEIKAAPYFPADGVVSTRFTIINRLAAPARRLAHVTVDATSGRRLAMSDVFTGDGWRAAVAAVCRAALTDAPALCDGAALADIANWRFAGRWAEVSLPAADGGAGRTFELPYQAVAAYVRADAPVGRLR